MQITTDDDYDAALDRAQELMGCTEGSEEDEELEQIANAIDEWAHKAKVRWAH